jgi:catechol 2,3-dioxygenase-like lactoylglutathione lyase family enzyme
MIRGIHHVAIQTSQFERMINFYTDVVGFSVVSRTEWSNNDAIDGIVGLKDSAARQVMLQAGTCYLEIFEYSKPAARVADPLRPCDRGYTHLCLDCVGVQAEYDRLTSAGVSFYQRPGDFGELSAVYGHDPDGNIIEIQETTPTHEFSLNRLVPRK